MSHEQMILEHLRSGGEITSLEGIERFKCIRTAARIKDLKDAGFDIRERWEYRYDERGKVEKKWKVWWIA